MVLKNSRNLAPLLGGILIYIMRERQCSDLAGHEHRMKQEWAKIITFTRTIRR